MDLCHIVAMSENRAIGKEGQMPWHIPAELKHFKQTTMGNCLIMGRKTYESIGRALPGRLNVVVTRNRDVRLEGVEVAHNLEAALGCCHKAFADGRHGPDIYVIGGGEIYRETIGCVDRIHLTVVHRVVEGDTFYPEFDRREFSVEEVHDYQEPEPYTTQVLVRRREGGGRSHRG